MKLRVAAVVLLFSMSVVGGRAGFAQEAQPALAPANPTGWAACDVALSASFVLILVPSLVPGVPVEIPVAVPSPVELVSTVLSAANPVFSVCTQLGPRPVRRSCSVDDQVPAAPVIVLPKPASFLVNQSAALEQAGVPAPTGELAAQLGC